MATFIFLSRVTVLFSIYRVVNVRVVPNFSELFFLKSAPFRLFRFVELLKFEINETQAPSFRYALSLTVLERSS